MQVKFLTDYPAAFISEEKMLVISDIHIGVESELGKLGVRIHKQIEKFTSVLDKLIEETKADTLVILGDVKHKVPGASMQELRDIPKFLNHLSTKAKIIICKGNHDDFLEKLIPANVKLYGSKGFRKGKYGFFHGHAWPSKALLKCDYIFMGHLQPAVEFRDKLGYRSRQQVWLKGKMDEKVMKKKYKTNKTGKLDVIVVPSFNPMLGSLNVMAKKNLSGPLLANNAVNLEEMKAYLLDGTSLGMLKNIRKKFRMYNI
ncbi:MAG: metallophosphoesterase [Candidatus Aenigmarchaeota archaeon]|nr:metallophosphoesterase [Candidatus Aenigmarchaeota archaeon]